MIRLVFILLLVSSSEIAHGKSCYNNNISCLQYGIVSGLTGLPGRPCPCYCALVATWAGYIIVAYAGWCVRGWVGSVKLVTTIDAKRVGEGQNVIWPNPSLSTSSLVYWAQKASSAHHQSSGGSNWAMYPSINTLIFIVTNNGNGNENCACVCVCMHDELRKEGLKEGLPLEGLFL